MKPMKQPRKMPSVKAIAAAWQDAKPWSEHVDEERAHQYCWRCAYDMRGNPTRAHIVAHRHGGSGEPRNFFLLCDKCHEEQPDAAPLDMQLAWLKSGQHWMDSFTKDRAYMAMMSRVQGIVRRLEREEQQPFVDHILATIKEQYMRTNTRLGARTAAVMAVEAKCREIEEWIGASPAGAAWNP